MNSDFLQIKGDKAYYDSVEAQDLLRSSNQSLAWIANPLCAGIKTLYMLTKNEGEFSFYKQALNKNIEAITEETFNAEFLFCDCDNADKLPTIGAVGSVVADIATENNAAKPIAESFIDVSSAPIMENSADADDSACQDEQPAPPIIDYEKIRQIFTEELEKFFKQKLG